jgi:hypothetical protein
VTAPTKNDLLAELHERRVSLRKQEKFRSEVEIDFPGLKTLGKAIMAFPDFVVCLGCDKSEFTISDEELHLLAQSAS